MPTENEADEDFEEFLEMSEAETDALLARLMKEHEAKLSKLDRHQFYRYRRARRLDLCLKQRAMAKEWPEIFMPMLRSTQRRLLEARIEYWTGAVAGHA